MRTRTRKKMAVKKKNRKKNGASMTVEVNTQVRIGHARMKSNVYVCGNVCKCHKCYMALKFVKS